MTLPKNCSIILESPRSVFYPGQTVSGSLEIEIETPLTFSVIYVNFLGEATVQWTELESEEVNGQKRYKNVNYVGREEYFKTSQLLAGSYGSVLNLNPGKYTYKFEYRLPRGIPSSYKGDRGGIVYSVTGHVEFQSQRLFKDQMTKYFDVVAPFDLNKGNNFVKEPIEMDFEEVYNCGCFCSSDPVSVRVRLPVSAYCPGQPIPVSVAVENNSSVEITHLIFEILTRQKYRTQRPIAEYVQPEEVLTTVKKGSIMSGNKRNFTVDLIVPDLIAPNLEDCSIIDVGYFFRITIKLSGCNDDLQDEAEICLGLIPLNETLKGTPYVHPMSHSLPIGPIPADEPNLRQETTPDQSGFRTVPISIEELNQRQDPTSVHSGFQTVPDGTSYFIQVNKQVISSDPSQNYQMGFKASYPPGSEMPSDFNQQMGQFNSQHWEHESFNGDLKIKMDNIRTTNYKYDLPNLAPDGFVPRNKSPVPSAPPM